MYIFAYACTCVWNTTACKRTYYYFIPSSVFYTEPFFFFFSSIHILLKFADVGIYSYGAPTYALQYLHIKYKIFEHMLQGDIEGGTRNRTSKHVDTIP